LGGNCEYLLGRVKREDLKSGRKRLKSPEIWSTGTVLSGVPEDRKGPAPYLPGKWDGLGGSDIKTREI